MRCDGRSLMIPVLNPRIRRLVAVVSSCRVVAAGAAALLPWVSASASLAPGCHLRSAKLGRGRACVRAWRARRYTPAMASPASSLIEWSPPLSFCAVLSPCLCCPTGLASASCKRALTRRLQPLVNDVHVARCLNVLDLRVRTSLPLCAAAVSAELLRRQPRGAVAPAQARSGAMVPQSSFRRPLNEHSTRR
jgi:hypothetical protein